jgi:hypothetical protein
MTRTIAPEASADRLAIRALIDGHAHCADRRDADGQIALFTKDSAFRVFMDSHGGGPSRSMAKASEIRFWFEEMISANRPIEPDAPPIRRGANA